MPSDYFDRIYYAIVIFANYRIFDMYLCRILAFVALVFLLYLSRLIASFRVKIFAVVIALVLYFFPDLVKKFVIG